MFISPHNGTIIIITNGSSNLYINIKYQLLLIYQFGSNSNALYDLTTLSIHAPLFSPHCCCCSRLGHFNTQLVWNNITEHLQLYILAPWKSLYGNWHEAEEWRNETLVKEFNPQCCTSGVWSGTPSCTVKAAQSSLYWVTFTRRRVISNSGGLSGWSLACWRRRWKSSTRYATWTSACLCFATSCFPVLSSDQSQFLTRPAPICWPTRSTWP